MKLGVRPSFNRSKPCEARSRSPSISRSRLKPEARSSPFTPIRSIRRGLEREAMEVAVDGLIGANIVSVSIVATAAVRSSANGSRAYRCRTDTVAAIPVAAIPVAAIAAPIACAAHCDSAAAPRSSNCDRAAAVAAATPIAAASAPSLGIIGDQAGGEQNHSGKRSENIAEHDRNLSTNSPSPAREIAALSAREVDVGQRNSRAAKVASHLRQAQVQGSSGAG